MKPRGIQMKHKAKKHRAKKHAKKLKAKTQERIVTLDISAAGDKILKSGAVDANGNTVVDPGDRVTFKYDAGTQTFALFIVRFTPNPGQGGGQHETPFDARMYITDDGEISKRVKTAGTVKKGRYEYRLALLDDNGDLVTHDPQIIVQ